MSYYEEYEDDINDNEEYYDYEENDDISGIENLEYLERIFNKMKNYCNFNGLKLLDKSNAFYNFIQLSNTN